TTSSLEALKALSLGDAKHQLGDEFAAMPFYKRAVELDPNFAMAYARLGTVYMNMGQQQLGEENRQKAFELRDRASEHEKLYITSHYYTDSGQLEKGITALELYKQTYPRDSIPYNNVAVIYSQLGQFENALDNARQAVALDPGSSSGYGALALAYAGLGRLEEAKAIINQELDRKLGGGTPHIMLAGAAWAQGDSSTVDRQLQLANTGPEGELNVLGVRTALAVGRGQMHEADDWGAKFRASSQRLGLTDVTASEYVQESVARAIVGDKAGAVRTAHEALKMSKAPNVVMLAAQVLALEGEQAEAEKLSSEVGKQRPYDTLIQYVQIPMARAAADYARGDYAKAIDETDGAMVYARTSTGLHYLRGMAYLKTHQAAEAVQSFQRIIDLRMVSAFDMLAPIAHLGLARAYTLQGDTAQARIAYQDFLASWKDADPDVPLLQQAKAEYAKLK